MNKEDTQIFVKKETREKLRKLKLYRRDSYDEVINRILNKLYKPNKKIEGVKE